MKWSEARKAYPDEWLIIEALEARTSENGRRILSQLAVLETCPDGESALERYRQLHRHHPDRELYFVHTNRKELEIYEQQWLGIRINNAVRAKR
ncbi:MAG: hypothetical protein P8X95_15725 [Anaerolineales bacterium]|jgi:hypothetical protein